MKQRAPTIASNGVAASAGLNPAFGGREQLDATIIFEGRLESTFHLLGELLARRQHGLKGFPCLGFHLLADLAAGEGPLLKPSGGANNSFDANVQALRSPF